MELKIIAELAQGFEGNYQQSRLLMKAAAIAGADAVKYQLVYADELATPGYKYYKLFKTLEMPDEEWQDLKKYSEELGIELHLEIFGNRSLKLAENIGAESVKLHGTDMNNEGLLIRIAKSSVHKVTLGAGGGYKSEILNALKLLKNKDVTVLLGFQGYPTPVNTNQIDRIRVLNQVLSDEYNEVKVGFADHADPDNKLSFALPAAAIGAGAKVIEKHLTLGKVMKMEDHESALNPDEFAEFTEIMRKCYASMGQAKEQDDFGMSEQESDYRNMIRRHVVANHTIPPGKKITAEDVVLKRSNIDQPLTNILAVYGKETAKEIHANSAITLTDLKN
jgi:sialic acid synthase SpsE